MAPDSTEPFAPPPSDPPAPLPQVFGPKLEPFTADALADVEFLDFLGDPENKDAAVWKVNINGRGPYALKMFLFGTWEWFMRNTGGCYLSTPLAKGQYYTDYFDPFNCECRAYGRLKQEQREDLAVQSYGYLFLSAEQEVQVANLMRSIGVTAEENYWRRHQQHRGHPVRAIQMWEDVQDLRRIGIAVRDIHAGNYIGGKLIDFSRSWTIYHPCFDWTDPRDMKQNIMQDAQDLLEAPQGLEECSLGKAGWLDANPTLYDWRKWESDPEAVGAFIDKELVVAQ
ncbi:kinetochore Sim4 complex subunit FTA2-domain-containing protein [Cladorrhinum sp. PSN332]|nr:kinetochore Sim4 complex subunit FTA2-domain-containing protein [Cladorrhinum sp. PSN332]